MARTLSLAVRSSATAEDLPDASFAGQHDSYLEHPRRAERCWKPAGAASPPSSPTARSPTASITASITSRSALSVGVMKMVRSDLAASGVIFTLDTESGFRDVVFITGAYGLGENVVQGAVDPDEFYVHKPTFERRPPLRCCAARWAASRSSMVYREGGTRRRTRNVPTPQADRERFCITDDEVLDAGRLRHHDRATTTALAGHPCRWTSNGRRTAPTASSTSCRRGPRRWPRSAAATCSRVTRSTGHGRGPRHRPRGRRAASPPARVRVHRERAQLAEFKPGEVLVADTTSPDWEPVMKTAAAIVTNRGGRTCHAAIVARELGIPAVVGCDDATTERSTTGDDGHGLLRRRRRRHASTQGSCRSTSTQRP